MPAVLATNPDNKPQPAVNQQWYIHESTDSDNLAIRPIEPATDNVVPAPSMAHNVPVATGTSGPGGSDGVRGLILNNFT